MKQIKKEIHIATVTLANGYTWQTRINGSPEQISDYFYGKLWDCEPFPSEKKSRCIRVVVSPAIIKAQRLNEQNYWDQPLAEDEDGNIYCDISLGLKGKEGEEWKATTPEGEPSHSVILEFNR